MNSIEAYPLAWPQGFPRTRFPERSRFKRPTFGRARDDLFQEIRRLGGDKIVLSTNIPLKKDGMPYATFASLKDNGVAVYFQRDRKPFVLACDRWQNIEDNIRAVTVTIEAMRGLERWGVSQMLERAFQGFMALPAPEAQKQWWEVLECKRDTDLEMVESIYRLRARSSHPDVGGTEARMAELNRAVNEARKELRQ